MAATNFMSALKMNVHDTAYNVTHVTRQTKLEKEDGSTIVSSKSVPVNINVIDNKYITGRKYRTSENQQQLTQAQTQFRKDVRKPRFSVAVSPKDPNYHPDINMNVPGVTITTP